MMNKKRKWMYYLVPILYVVSTYAFCLLLYLCDNAERVKQYAFFIPFVMGIINFIIVITVGRKWSKKTLLNCALIIKYGLIPFYLIGGCLTALVMLLTIFPLPLMVVFGLVAIVFLIYGYGILLGGAPYSIAYIIKACKAGSSSKAIAVPSAICQFIFSLDVITMMILTLKEKHLVKTTIFIFIAICISLLLIVLWIVLIVV